MARRQRPTGSHACASYFTWCGLACGLACGSRHQPAALTCSLAHASTSTPSCRCRYRETCRGGSVAVTSSEGVEGRGVAAGGQGARDKGVQRRWGGVGGGEDCNTVQGGMHAWRPGCHAGPLLPLHWFYSPRCQCTGRTSVLPPRSPAAPAGRPPPRPTTRTQWAAAW